jgi:hypothetical protein
MKKLVIVFVICAVSMTAFACSGGTDKPSKEAVVDHLVEISQGEDAQFFDEDQLREIYQCLLDEAYDDLSTETLTAMAELSPEELDTFDGEVSESDQEALDKAQDKCSKEITERLESSISTTTAP